MRKRTLIKRTAPPKRVNVKRKRSEFARCYGSKKRVEWVRSQRCVMCGDSPCENAHIETGGMGRKADYDKIVPMCSEAHKAFHQYGRSYFENRSYMDFKALAAETERRWQEEAA